jgi:predicted PurR-regulated permease PerM
VKQPPGRDFPWVPAAIILTAVGLAVHFLRPVLIPFALAFAAAYILNPLAAAAEVRGLRRSVVVIGAFVLAGLTLAGAAGTLIPMGVSELSSLQQEAPAYAARLKLAWLDFQLMAAERLPFAAAHIRDVDPAVVVAPLLDTATHLPKYLMSAVPLLSLLFLIPFIGFFALLDGPNSITGMIQRCPSRYVEQMMHLSSEIDRSLGAYLRGLVIIALAIAAASYVGLKLLGVNQAFWISVLAGVTSFVPYLGAIVGMVVGGLAAAFQFGTMAAGLKVVLLFLVIRLADEIILQPYIAKHSVHLHPLLFLFTFMTGGDLFGFIGLLFAVPVACVIKALLTVAWSWYSSESHWSVEESDAPPVPYT